MFWHLWMWSTQCSSTVGSRLPLAHSHHTYHILIKGSDFFRALEDSSSSNLEIFSFERCVSYHIYAAFFKCFTLRPNCWVSNYPPSPYPTLFYRTGSLMWYVCAKCLCDIRLANSQMQTAVQSRYLALISTAFSQLHTLETASVLSPHLSKLPHTHTHKVTQKNTLSPQQGVRVFA